MMRNPFLHQHLVIIRSTALVAPILDAVQLMSAKADKRRAIPKTNGGMNKTVDGNSKMKADVAMPDF